MVIMAFGALAVDMGYLDYQHMRMQNATDDAALKGAKALIPNRLPESDRGEHGRSSRCQPQRLPGRRADQRHGA